MKRNKEGHQENPVSSQYIAKNCINIKMHAAQVRQGVTRTQGLLKSGNKMSEIVFKIAQNVYLMTKKKLNKKPLNFSSNFQKIVKALGQAWHENHFVCDGPCKKELSGKEFFVRDGKPYCKEDFENIFASRCHGCAMPISDKAIVALDVTWHKDCFTCKVCVSFLLF